ncbi:unnamed protein product [Spirodela intermedia]|uniref:Uncharacterized protein n=1 Tax=Spirodela intermedia TaxID=51605 RepID=A0A7I8LFB3_SPIIN|nr:unnamed protein product [Spirodela intermedia]
MRMDKLLSNSVSPQDGKSSPMLAIECVAGSSKADEWNFDMLQTGDIVEEITIGGSSPITAPFKHGCSGVQKMLRSSFKRGETSISVRVRRGRGESVSLHACVVPHEQAGRKSYMLRSIDDPNYAVAFVDRLESECLQLQASRSSRVASALSKSQLQDGYVSYPWEKKMRESLSVPNSSSFLSLLILPKASNPSSSHYNSFEDTLARGNTWLNSSQASGVPIVFLSAQSEPLLTKISGETASSTVNAGSLTDLCNLANASLYGFEDYHGVDIGVVRAIRLWYAPAAGEYPLEIRPEEGDSRLGFAVGRTQEGFIFVSSVANEDDEDDDSPATRSGLRDLYREAVRAGKHLVISRVSNEKILPWMVSPSGAIRCFDTVSLSRKLSLHRHALQPILLHILLWDLESLSPNGGSRRSIGSPIVAAEPPSPATPAIVESATDSPPPIELQRDISLSPSRTSERDAAVAPAPPPPPPPSAAPARDLSPPPELVREISLSISRSPDRDTSGSSSFRFHDFSIQTNWV